MTDITENGKYYTPTKEEFHVGFEYEWEDAQYPEYVWDNAVIKEGAQIDDIHGMRFEDFPKYNIRVKHLDVVDIQSFDFSLLHTIKYDPYPERSYADFEIRKHNIQTVMLRHFYNTGVVIINKGMAILFHGTILNKIELQRIMRQIGITV